MAAAASQASRNLAAIVDRNGYQLDGQVDEVMGDRAAGRQMARLRLGSPRGRRPRRRGARRDAPLRSSQGRPTATSRPSSSPTRSRARASIVHGEPSPAGTSATSPAGGRGRLLAEICERAMSQRTAPQPESLAVPRPARPGAAACRALLGHARRARRAGPSRRRLHRRPASTPTGSSASPRRFPERFVQFGISEQNMVTAAAGLATTGLMPYVATFASFLALLCCEQIRTDVAYSRPARAADRPPRRDLARLLRHVAPRDRGHRGHARDRRPDRRRPGGRRGSSPPRLRASVDHEQPIYFRIAPRSRSRRLPDGRSTSSSAGDRP